MMTFHMLGYTVLFLLWVCCTAQNDDCGPPPRRNNEELAELSVKQSYSHNEIVQYNCRPGYIKLGRIKVRCDNGNWNPVPPHVECQKRPCGHPGDIQFGSFEIVRGDEFVFGARVEYQCDPGYQMLSQTNYRDCRADGWSNDVPHCEVRKCFPVTPPKNGRIVMSGIHSLDQEFVFGQALRFECNAKFKIVGSKQIVCADEGQWHPDVPTCEEIICKSGNIAHGYITSLKSIYREGDELQFSCHNGYKPIDRSLAVCSENGWNTRLECTEIVCSRPEVNNGRVNPHQEQYSHEQSIQIECDSGYQPERQETISRCTKDGWIPQPRCVSKLCDYPEVENIEVHGAPEYYKYRYFPKRERDIIDFRCINGFLSANKQTWRWQRSTCTKVGWDPEPKCFKQCDHTINFPHVNFIHGYWSKFIEGNDISFSCDTGYYPEQQGGKAKCTKNGWSPTPRCITREIPTCQNDPPPNGFFTDRKDRFGLNERTRYSCRIGFTTREGLEEGETQCRTEGWTPKPECVKTCQKPTEGNVIISMNKKVFLLKENLYYKCEVGYETIEKNLEGNSTCTVNGWSPSLQCLPIQCEGLILDNGSIEPRKNQYLYSDVVRFSCHSRNTRVGPHSAQCYHFGWSPPPPICKAPGEVNSCQPPSNITDGRIITDFQEEYPHGQQVEYECNLKYAMIGSKKIECVDGQWTSLPSCTVVKKTCGLPPHIRNGHALSTNQKRYFHGDAVRYECNDGSAVVGTNPAKCLHGQWDLPSCDDDCAPPKIPKNTNSDPLKRRYNSNEVVSYSCDSRQHKTICNRGTWSPKPDCRELCAPPPHVPNATEIIEVRNYENGETIRFTCKEHFLLEGPEEISCKDGKWETPPRCIDASCGDPPPIANGGIVNGTQGKYLPGKKVEYRCNEGFGISQIKFSTCRNRVWSQTPSCKEKSCRPPPQVVDASLTERERKNYQPGDIVHYICNPGFATDRPLNVTCRKGQWTQHPTCEDATCGEPPTVSNAAIVSERLPVYMPGHRVQYQCSPGFEMSGSDSITCGIKVWSEPPTCKDVTCPPPNEIAHGKIVGQPKERYMPSDTVRFQCIQGWSLFGPVVATCFNMQWTELPRCIDAEGNCGRPPSIENGDVLSPLQAEYTPGTTLKYKCQSLYVMNGTSQVRCENGHWTEAPTCIEACTISEEDMARNNIQLRWTNNKKLYSESGDTVEFTCKQGYWKPRSSPPFRAQCIEGKVNYPRCIYE